MDAIALAAGPGEPVLVARAEGAEPDRVGVSDARRQRERLGELFDRHDRRLYRLAVRLSGDAEEARDLVQEAFLRVARRIERLPAEPSGAEAWLVRTLVNLCRDRARRRRVRERWQAPADAATLERMASPRAAAPLARLMVERALRRLRPRRRAVLVLCELEQLSVREAADLLGLRPPTVRWHLAGARRELRRAVEGLDLEEDAR